LIRAFLGLVRISISVSLFKSSNVATTGNLPTNSGIKPNFNRSSGSSFFKISPVLKLFLSLTSASNPIEDLSPLLEIILSIPAKAEIPQEMAKMPAQTSKVVNETETDEDIFIG